MPVSDWNSELYESSHGFVWRYGSDVLARLEPQAGESILDLGCGTGQLTAQIAAAGATVLGLDSSPAMVGQARQNYPKLTFRLADARTFAVEYPVDAVFSNAVLHWVPEAAAVAGRVAAALKPGGRFVAELGGQGNAARIHAALATVLRERGLPVEPGVYFPSVGEYSTVLESQGLEVRWAELFDRPTPLEGADGMRAWITMFHSYMLPEAQREAILDQVEDLLRPALFRDGQWFADYRRLRLRAQKP